MFENRDKIIPQKKPCFWSGRAPGWIALGVLLLGGCSGNRFPTAPVEGRVTLDGRPLAGVRISFQPTGGQGDAEQGSGSYAKTDDQGRFYLKSIRDDRPGAVVGVHVVRMSAHMDQKGLPADDRPLQEQYRLPRCCRDGTLTFEVPPEGTDQANFDLRSS